MDKLVKKDLTIICLTGRMRFGWITCSKDDRYNVYLEILGFKIGLETQIDLIKQSLNNFYS